MQRVFGPYCERGGRVWRVIHQIGVGRAARKVSHSFASEAEAQAAADHFRANAGATTCAQAVEEYLDYLAHEGRKAGTIVTARYRLEGFFKQVRTLPVKELGPARAQKLYDVYAVGRAPDTHQGALFLTKSMFEWLRKKKKLVKENPFDDVDPSGRKSHGKPQLKKDDTRKLYRWLVAHALDDDRALGALMALTLGLRAHEVVGRTAEHLDCDGTELMVTESKTRAGVRSVSLHPLLAQALAKRAEMRSGRLLPYAPPWVRASTKWACTQAGVPTVCAQALRGMYATATLSSGLDPNAVAKSLGHTNVGITRSAYAAGGSEGSAKSKQVIEALEQASVAKRPFLN